MEELRINWDYYAPRTDHTFGSSLGPAVHAWAACPLGDPEEVYTHFMCVPPLADISTTSAATPATASTPPPAALAGPRLCSWRPPRRRRHLHRPPGTCPSAGADRLRFTLRGHPCAVDLHQGAPSGSAGVDYACAAAFSPDEHNRICEIGRRFNRPGLF